MFNTKKIIKAILPSIMVRFLSILVRESKVIRNLGILGILRLLVIKTKDQDEHVHYKPRYFTSELKYDDVIQDEFCSSGFFSYYFGPKTALRTEISKNYPHLDNYGIKIFETATDSVKTTVPKSESVILHKIGQSLNEQIITYSFFDFHKLGPCVYDLICIKFVCGSVRFGLVVEDIPNEVTKEEFYDVVAKVKKLINSGSINNLTYNVNDQVDFDYGYGNSNVRRRVDGSVVYVDLHNFSVSSKSREYIAIEKELKATHFGDESLLLGNQYLYQSIPNIAVGGKRNTDFRKKLLTELLMKHIGDLDNYTVLDVGCNLGQMFSLYQERGSLWVTGLDTPENIKVANRLLKLQGVIRTSLFGVDICSPSKTQIEFISKIPSTNLLISYLSIVKHVGWPLYIFKDLNWRYMLFEAHENETNDKINEYLKELRRIVNIEIVETVLMKDGTSNERIVMLIKKGDLI